MTAAAGAGGWEVTVAVPGGPEARIRASGGAVSVEPPEAAAHPFVAAAVAEIRRTLMRPRTRPACATEPARRGR